MTKKYKKMNVPVIELGKETTTSVIAVQRDTALNIKFLNPKELDELYASVPEVSRAVDLRGSAIISRGFEITPRDDSQEAKDFASMCLGIINDSGGNSFLELWQKNSDLYGNGYVELVTDGSSVVKLVPIHAFNFGYELEEFVDPVDSQTKTRVKLDKDTQEPIGYAQYTFNQTKNYFENLKKFDLDKIAHLKYKVIGDALYGISIAQPMFPSILRKLQIEGHMESAARLVSSPKIVISGKFPTEEAARKEAKEAASLDVSDVVVLDSDEGKTFEIVNPGNTNLPQLREIFVVNITTASGVPRPILTSESSEINKSTMQELMKQLRENMRSNMNKMKNLIEKQIFTKIGEQNGVANYASIIPIFSFPEDIDTEQEIIIREEKKAATITSMTNSLMILNNMLLGSANTPPNTEMKELIKGSMAEIFNTMNKTLTTFSVNNDQTLGQIEEMPIGEDGKPINSSTKKTSSTPKPTEDIKKEEVKKEEVLKLDDYSEDEDDMSSPEIYGLMEPITFIDDPVIMKVPGALIERHNLMHRMYEHVRNGSEVYDIVTGKLISLPAIIEKHNYYLKIMREIGVLHEMSSLASELDEISHK